MLRRSAAERTRKATILRELIKEVDRQQAEETQKRQALTARATVVVAGAALLMAGTLNSTGDPVWARVLWGVPQLLCLAGAFLALASLRPMTLTEWDAASSWDKLESSTEVHALRIILAEKGKSLEELREKFMKIDDMVRTAVWCLIFGYMSALIYVAFRPLWI